MKKTVEYKGYIGSVEVDEEGQGFAGKVLNITDEVVLYCGRNYKEFIQIFHEAVDDYIEEKKKKNEEPIAQFKGSFNVRVKPEVHRDAVVFAREHNTSLNKLVELAIKEKIYGH